MKRKSTVIISAIGIFLLIIDSKTAISGGKEGVSLCIQTVIPSLFPFFVLSGFLCRNLTGANLPFLRPLGYLCAIPKGAESLLLLGLLGGYPVGAQNIRNAVSSGVLDKRAAKRMLGFCNNAGPAFIFGMAGYLFSRAGVSWALWSVHIVSAVLVGIILPGKVKASCRLINVNNGSFLTDVQNSLKTMANVCGWVILFRVVISFLKRWCFWFLPVELQVLLTGTIELSNGVIDLVCLSNQGLRFIICSVILSLGGFCVTMQTLSIAGSIGMGYYFPGKILQGCISFVFASLMQKTLFSGSEIYNIPWYLLVSVASMSLIMILILRRNKNYSRIVSPCLI